MSATDRLRSMLTERGVEWLPSVFDPQHETFYSVENGVGFIVTEFPEIGRVSLACDMRITPEQAVEATLGRGECHDMHEDDGYFKCSECGGRMHGWTEDDSAIWFSKPHFCPNCGRRIKED